MRSLTVLLALGSCVDPGSFCTQYLPLDLSREGASALVQADRGAAERAATNEESWRDCP